MRRRDFLIAAAAAAVARPALAVGAPEARRLRAAPAQVRLVPEGGPETPVWGYEGAAPGPVLRVRRGERLTRRFENALPQGSSVHWHGVRVPNAMDGVPGLTQDSVAPGEDFLYDFVAPDAGTYWYHSHDRSWEQSARGLHGGLVVEEAEAPDVDRDHLLVLDDWRLDAEAAIQESFGAGHDWSHAGRIGGWVTVNGAPEPAFPARRGERLRLRLLNAANARLFFLSLHGLEGWIMARDGQPLERPERLTADQESPLALGPGERVDLVADAAGEDNPALISWERDGGYVLASFPLSGPEAATRAAPAALAPNSLAPLGPLAEARRAALALEGGAMGRMTGAMTRSGRRDMRSLLEDGLFWAMGGDAGMPAEPLVEAARGETVRVNMPNDTAFPHAMHLHGHHFREVTEAGLGPWRDTVLLAPGETREIAFVADNPGDWLIHCHMLEHQAAGMKSWLRVS
jgi:FtsP/CotA-like multicopper oxidase with cupredoxin domain